MGQLGMNVTDLYDLTPSMFYNAQRGMFEKWEMDNQSEWERARWMTCVIINPHVKKNLKPQDVTRFPWERKRNEKTREEIESIKAEALLFQKIDKLKMKKDGKE